MTSCKSIKDVNPDLDPDPFWSLVFISLLIYVVISNFQTNHRQHSSVKRLQNIGRKARCPYLTFFKQWRFHQHTESVSLGVNAPSPVKSGESLVGDSVTYREWEWSSEKGTTFAFFTFDTWKRCIRFYRHRLVLHLTSNGCFHVHHLLGGIFVIRLDRSTGFWCSDLEESVYCWCCLCRPRLIRKQILCWSSIVLWWCKGLFFDSKLDFLTNIKIKPSFSFEPLRRHYC